MQPMTKLTIPPMPILECDAPLWPYIIRLEAWSRDLAAIAQRETALADELAEALRNLMSHKYEANYDLYLAAKLKAAKALRAYTAARQMNKEAR